MNVDPAECSTTGTTDTGMKTLDETFEAIKQQNSNYLSKWSQAFLNSEGFDNFYEARIDELIKEAKLVEEALTNQKAEFMNRLRGITETLKSTESSTKDLV